MRKLAGLLLVFAAITIGYAQTATSDAKPPAPKPPPPKIKIPDPKASAAKDAKKDPKKDAKKDAKKKEDEIGKVEGMEIARGGRYMGVQIVNGGFRLNFYNDKKKPIAPDVDRAVLRWDPKYKLGLERVVLTRSGENSLAAEKFVRPPYNFKLTIVLLRGSSEATADAAEAGETFVVDFRQ